MPNSVLRQIHLDFHTSGVIRPIADHFDAGQFAETLANAHVNSVNVTSKCLHGYSYYPTQIGVTHPGLSRDLLGEQLAALRARGIKAPVYLGVLWDDLAAIQHPEWVAVNQAGELLARPAFSNESVLDHGRGWSVLDLASGYTEYVLAQVEEICQRYHPDGFWLDIVSVVPNYSPAGLERMRAAGVDVTNPEAVQDHYLGLRNRFIERIAALVHSYVPEASIFHNHTTDGWIAPTIPFQRQVDVESLPTDGSWGYVHYPVYARYARTFGLPVLGMTGRFHRSWGDFGGLKTADQLTYEVGTILSAGGSPSVGDQLDPSGALEPAVYRAIGDVYERIAALDPWLAGFEPLAEAAIIAQWVPSEADPGRVASALSLGVVGAAQMLLAQGVQFDVVDGGRIVPGRYRLLVVPDDARLTEADQAAVSACLAAGSALLSAGAAVPADRSAPCTVSGLAGTVPSYFRPGTLADGTGELAADYPYACYGQAYAVTPTAGAETIGHLIEARFNRTWEHFTSHAQAPVGSVEVGPLACRKDRWAHVALPLFSDFAREAYWSNAAVAGALIERLLPDRVLSHDGPDWVEVTAHHGAGKGGAGTDTTAVHFTVFQPRRSTNGVPRLDGTQRIAGFRVRLRVEGAARRVYRAPDGEPVPFAQVGGPIVEFEPEWIDPHTVIAVEHGSND